MRLGVFGGTFDPIHLGHLIIAQEILDRGVVDRVLFVPAGNPWMKSAQAISPAEHRLAMVPLARRGVYPLTLLLQMVPLVAIAPMLVIWFGYGAPSVIAAACIVSIFPVIAGTLDGLQSVDPGLRELFGIHRASRIRTWWLLGLPSSLPNIFTGLRIAAGLAVIGAVVGEFVGAYGGTHAPIGAVITSALKQNRTDVVFAAIVLASMLGFVLFGAVNLIGWACLRRWHASAQ